MLVIISQEPMNATVPTLMFVVNGLEHDDAFSIIVAELYDIWLSRSAGGRAAETTVCRL